MFNFKEPRYIPPFESLGSVKYFINFGSVFYAHQGCIYLIKNTVKTVIFSHLNSIKNLLQFKDMIKCTVPDSSPLLDFADYGCFCGLGGTGTPVDQLDQCCFTHDACYGTAITLESCSSLFDDPYTNIYDYKCDENTKTVTCLDSNDECDMFVCQCDKTAAECFAQAPYNASNNHLSSNKCT
uniref:Phospholipase A2 n=1 Tax=Sinocyclocheilus rhinocerous TaxID=307959 RepID=A0A673GCH3_9TELE